MAKYHISGKGEPEVCTAEIKCRLGGESGQENHYDSPEEARAGYESKQAEKSIPKVRRKKTDSEIATTGTEKQIQALAKKKNLPIEVALAAHDRVNDPATKAQFELHKDFPVEKMTSDGFNLLKKKSPMSFHRRAIDSEITYDQVKSAPNSATLNNPHNKLSPEDLVKITTDYPEYRVETAINNAKYPLQQTVDQFDDDELGRIASHTRNPINARVASQRLLENGLNINEHTLSRIAGNKYNSPTTLEAIAREKENFYSDIAIANNPSADRVTKELVASRNKAAASIVKLDDLQKDNPNAMYQVSSSMNSTSEGRKRIIKFNKNAVEEAGLEPNDIDAFVRFKQGDWLHDAKYDSETATYTGYID